jgi:PAS domain S-box-containing protein
MDLKAVLLTSPFFLAAIGAVVALCVPAIRRARKRRALAEPDVPRRDVTVGKRWKYSEILEYTHDAIVIWEMGGKGIVYWNSAAERIYGFSRAEAIGRTTHVLLRTQLDGGIDQLEAKLARFGVWAGELRHTTKAGGQILVQSRLALMSQHNGRWLVLEVNRDIGPEYRQAEIQAAVEAHLRALRAKPHEEADRG